MPRQGSKMIPLLNFRWACCCFVAAATMAAQQPPQAQQQQQIQQATQPTLQPLQRTTTGAEAPASERLRPTYVLGPGDQITIRAIEFDDLGDKPYRVEGDGSINLPTLGRLQAGGQSVEQVEAELVKRLKEYVKMPQAIVTIVQFRSEPVFVVGAFKSPGIYPLQGRRTLVEMLTSIGGLQPNASRRIRLTRRAEVGTIPLPGATEDKEKGVSSVEIGLASLTQSINPAEDLVLQPFDMIAVDRAEMVYVSGEVGRVGAFELGERESISVTQLVTLAGGLGREASGAQARILRPVLNTSRRAEIPINLTRILRGNASDFPLLPNDVLHVPRSGRRVLFARLGYIAIPMIPTLIYLVLR